MSPIIGAPSGPPDGIAPTAATPRSSRPRRTNQSDTQKSAHYRQPPQLLTQLVGAGDDHAAQLHERKPTHVDRAAASKQKQPQRLALLPRSRQRRSFAGERRAGRADRVERVVLTLQPPLVAWAAASLEHRLAAAAQMTSKPGTVMACTLDGPHASAICSGLSEAQRLRVPACARTHRSSRDNDTGTGNDNREHVLIAMRINSDQVVHFICKHLD